ncbi:tyrosine-type recombinase/integrase [Aliivibrio fischeri]|uniref:tyrosine-type recombinase/integrase n=1 Tax=Aliivibrio fischeri TaxID=668 RepID=UPI0007C57E6B|nr:tyrosine-type recombinase/integrase [Aliivibrio fischeri]MBP3140476.1 tyrosine-type recombinase/integrase [Aliivibrio fischeri]MBP3156206.1 tyrosine-type recombinase/integrase [Aliivibrio fischeri]MCE7574655.1 tyrosine-type recombinase/integrase [Aliivibrio fischeri]
MISIVYTKLNLGSLSSFDGELIALSDKYQIRNINYQRSHVVDKFPLLFSETRLNDCLEANLFLEYRYKGKFLRPKKGGQRNLLGGVTVKTVKSIANSLKIFLTWSEEAGIEWKDLYAVSASEKAKEWLPPYRYRAHLIERIKSNELSLNTANLYLSHVRQLYEWARQTKRIEKLPFKYIDKVIKKKRSSAEFDLIFTSFHNERGIEVQTNDLTIPRKNKQKKMVLNDGLAPFNQKELMYFYSAHYMQVDSRRLWADLALLCGLRAFEITLLNETEIMDTSLDETKVYAVNILGKFNKYRQILIPRTLMSRLWDYNNSPERLKRSIKWDIKNEKFNKPLFINRSGNRLNEGSITNITSIVATQLSDSKIKFERSFHDLRSTFATSLARFLLENDLPLGFIQYKLMSLLGHSNFSTTQKYINLARIITYDKRMKSWVEDVFSGIELELSKEKTDLDMGSN